jgi:hypothetical protein
MKHPFGYFKTSPEIIRLAVMMYVRFRLSLRDVEGLLHECGIDRASLKANNFPFTIRWIETRMHRSTSPCK